MAGYPVINPSGVDIPNVNGISTHYNVGEVVPLSKLISRRYSWLVERGYLSEAETNDWGSAAWGEITGTLSAQTDLQSALDLKAPLSGPTFTGTVTLPSTTSIGTVSSTEIGYLDGVTSAIQTQLDAKLNLSGGTLTGSLTLPGTAGTRNLFMSSGYAVLGLVTIGRSGAGYGTIGDGYRTTSLANSYNYDRNDYATMLSFSSGAFSFQTSALGTAGNPVTFAERFFINNAGDISNARDATIGRNLTVTGTTTLSGDLTISKATPELQLRTTAATQTATLSLRTGGTIRWGIAKNGTAETGSNAGSDLKIVAYADDGSTAVATTTFQRSTGNITTGAQLTVQGKVSINAGTPAAELDLGDGTSGRRITWGGSSGDTQFNNIWSSYSGGALVIGRGIKGTTSSSDGYLSSYGSAIARHAFRQDSSGWTWLYEASSTKAVDTAITPSTLMSLSNAGVLSTTSLSLSGGITAGTTASSYNSFSISGSSSGAVIEATPDSGAFGVGIKMLTAGGWARSFSFRDSGGTTMGAFGGTGTGGSLSYLYIGAAYNDAYHTKFYPATGNVTIQGALTSGATTAPVLGAELGDGVNMNQTVTTVIGNTYYVSATTLTACTISPAGNNGETTLETGYHRASFVASATSHTLTGTGTGFLSVKLLSGVAPVGATLAGQELRAGTFGDSIAIGAASQRYNSTHSNTSLGYSALANVVTGYGNTALGYTALAANSVGYYNVATGYAALATNTRGYYNVGNGFFSLNLLTTGAYNTSMGTYSGRYLTTGWGNTYVGSFSGYGVSSTTTGQYNTSVGYYAGANFTSGSYNVSLGAYAGYSGTTGSISGAVLIGTDSTGAAATATANNSIVLGTGNHTTYLAGAFSQTLTTDSSSSTTGAATFAGGVGIAKKLYVGTNLNVAGTATITTLDLSPVADTATAATHYFVETATDGFVRPKTLANVKTEIVTTAAVNAAAATTLGTITSGTWQGSVINSTYIDTAIARGAASSTDNAVARFDTTTGKLIQNSGVIIDDSNNVSGIAKITATTQKALDGTFAGRRIASQALTNNAWTTIQPGQEDADIGGNMASGVYTVPTTGVYLFTCSTATDFSTAGTNLLRIYDSTNSVAIANVVADNFVVWFATVTGMAYLTAGTTIEFQWYTTSGTGKNIASNSTWIGVTFIGTTS